MLKPLKNLLPKNQIKKRLDNPSFEWFGRSKNKELSVAKQLSNGLGLDNLSKPDIRFLENRAGDKASGLDIFEVSGDTNSVIAITKQLRSTCNNFPDKALAIALTKRKDVLVTINGVLHVCVAGKNLIANYRIDDVKLDGKVTSRRLRRIEDLTDELEVVDYKTRKPNSVPKVTDIGYLENYLGYKLPSEYKQFLQTRGAVKYEYFNTIGLTPNGSDDSSMHVRHVLDDIEEISEGSFSKLPKHALPIIEDTNGGYILYLTNSEKIALWGNDYGYTEVSGFSSIDEAILDQLLNS